MKVLLMGNINLKDLIKYSIIIILTFLVYFGSANAQQNDCLTRGINYHVSKSQVDSNTKQIKLLEYQKKNLSIFDKKECIERSRIQAVISAKENENFRLQRKMQNDLE